MNSVGWVCCEQFEIPEVIQREDVVRTHRSEVFGFANSFIHSLCILHGILKQFDWYLSSAILSLQAASSASVADYCGR